MADTIKFKRGTEATIPSLADGEPGFTTDTHKLFVGQGGTNYQIGGSSSSPLTTKGDLYTHYGTSDARLAVGADGAYLVADSAESTGLKWVKNNLGASAAPTVNDDSGSGYAVGSRWIDTTNDKEYVCLDASAGAAVWTETTGGGTLDINGLTAADPALDDEVPIYDTSASANRKVTFQDVVDPKNVDWNHLFNPEGKYFQRQAAETLTSYSDDNYGPDRWNLLTSSTDAGGIQTKRVAGDVARYAIEVNQADIDFSSRWGLEQIIESAFCRHLRGQPVRLQFKVKPSTTMDIRYAIVEWTGTEDSVTSDIVNDWSSSTYTAGNFFIANTIAHTAATNCPSGSWTEIALTATLGSTFNNLIVFVWSEDTQASGTYFDLTEVGLYQGQEQLARDWRPRPPALEEILLQRYYERWVVPSDSGDVWRNSAGQDLTVSVNTIGNGVQWGQVIYKVQKRTTPTIRVSPYTTGSSTNQVSNNVGSDLGSNSGVPVTSGTTVQFGVQNNSGGSKSTGNYLILFKWAADAEM